MAIDEQIHPYKSLVTESCLTIEIPNEVLNCIDPNCSTYNSVLEQLCSQLVNCLMVTADRIIPKCGGKRLAGWNEEVRKVKDKSILYIEQDMTRDWLPFCWQKYGKSWYKYA